MRRTKKPRHKRAALPFVSEGEAALAGIAEKISERPSLPGQHSLLKYGQLFDFAPYGYLSLNKTGRIGEVNLVGARMLGLTRELLVGRSLTEFIAPESQETFRLHLRDVISEDAQLQAELGMITAGGGSFVTRMESALANTGGADPLLLSAMIDITELKRGEEALKTALRLSQELAPFPVEEIMSRGLDEGVRLTGSQIGYFHIINPDQKTILLTSWSRETFKYCSIKEKDAHYPIEAAGVWVDCIHQRRPIIHNDYASLPHRKGLPDGHVPVTRDVGVPIFEEGTIVAVIGVGNKQQPYDQFDVAQLSVIAETVWMLVRRRQVEDKLRWNSTVDSALAELSNSLSSPAFSLEQMQDATLKHAMSITGSRYGYISTVDPATGVSKGRILNMTGDTSHLVRADGEQISFSKGVNGKYPGLLGNPLNTGRPFFTNDPSSLPDSSELPGGPALPRNFLSVPSLYEGVPVGQIALADRDGNYWEQDLEAITRIAQVNAMAIQRRSLEARLHAASITDELTGLLNRRGFMGFAEKLFDIARRTGRQFSTIYMDLNDLKMINDRFGHTEGDRALVAVAKVLRNTFRSSDILGRIGGDEFTVLLNEPSGKAVEKAVVQHLRANLEAHNQKSRRGYDLSLSIGIADFDPAYVESIEDLLSKADEMMYEQKQRLKNGGDDELIEPTGNRLEHRQDIRISPIEAFRAEFTFSDCAGIKNVSRSGICLSTSRKLNLNQTYEFLIVGGAGMKMSLKGLVVWSSSLVRTSNSMTSNPSYEAGMKFIELDEGSRHVLDTMMNQMSH